MTLDACCVHIVDDDEAVQRSTQLLLSGCGLPSVAYSSAEDFLARSTFTVPSCVILDLRMPGMGGERLLAELAGRDDVPPILVLTAHGSIESAVRSLKQGAVEFLLKPCSPDELLTKVRQAIGAHAARLARQSQFEAIRARLDCLTPRERDVLRGLMRGHSSARIAQDLALQPKSIEVYRSHVLNKLGFGSTVELVRQLLLMDPQAWADDGSGPVTNG